MDNPQRDEELDGNVFCNTEDGPKEATGNDVEKQDEPDKGEIEPSCSATCDELPHQHASSTESVEGSEVSSGGFIDIEIVDSDPPLVEQVFMEMRSIKPVLLQTDSGLTQKDAVLLTTLKTQKDEISSKSPQSKLFGAFNLTLNKLLIPSTPFQDISSIFHNPTEIEEVLSPKPQTMKKQQESQPSSGNGSVPFYMMFAFADTLDFILMTLGSVGAIINGLGQIMVVLIFGTLTDAFGDVSSRTSYDGYNLVKSISKVSETLSRSFCSLTCSASYIAG